ncbi:MAG: acyltransferase [Bacteroidia bacterium]|nr:acyltransferase [Bacteroidia bacterium]
MNAYLPNLDGLRFIGFCFIFFAHAFSGATEESTAQFGDMLRDLNYLGFVGLDFFFVLSSFLITYTLLNEAERRSRVDFKKYFVRRALRIWPLYFLLIGMGFAGQWILARWGIDSEPLPSIGYFLSFTLNFGIISDGTHFLFFLVFLWSVCVEEQFYIFWGAVLTWMRNHLLKICLLLIFVSLFFRWYFSDRSEMLMFHTVSLLGNFGVGGILALAAVRRNELFENLASLKRSTWFLVYTLLVLNLFFYHRLYDSALGILFERFFLSILFALIIFEQCFSPDRLFSAGRFGVVRYLGKISYGLYMYHGVVITLVWKAAFWFGESEEPVVMFLWRPLLILTLTIGLAAISFHTFERPFLRWKEKLSA